MAIGAFFFLLGTLGTGLTYVMAEPGDEYLLLYGAIAGGLVGFLRGLRSWRQSPSASFPTLLVGIAGALPVLFIAGIYVKASWDRAAGRERVAQMLREEQERRGVDTAGTDAAPDPISAYIVVLKNAQDPAARREAVWRLGEMRQGARDAAPELLAALRDPHPRVRRAGSGVSQRDARSPRRGDPDRGRRSAARAAWTRDALVGGRRRC
jgi:hypothetical protein